MNNITPRVQKAIDTLVEAFNNKTLIAGHCVACAVGNLIANGLGAEIKPTSEISGYYAFKDGCKVDNYSWQAPFMSETMRQFHDVSGMISVTDFTFEELQEIEKVFERNTDHKYADYMDGGEKVSDECLRKDQLKGLKAVVKTMLKLDNCEGADIDDIFTGKIKSVELIPS